VKILQVCPSPAWGGLEHYPMRVLTPALKGRGHEVHWLVRPGTPLEGAASDQGETTFLLPSGYANYSPANIKMVRRLCREHRYDMVVVHRPKDVYLLSAVEGGQRVLFRHMNPGTKDRRTLFHRWVYRFVDRMLCTTQLMKTMTVATYPIAAERVEVVPYGVDPLRFQVDPQAIARVRNDWGVDEGQPVAGIIGRLDPQKGQDVFVAAAAQVLQQLPEARFVIVGEETKGEEGFGAQVHRQVASLGLQDRILFRPFARDVAPLMAALDVFVLATHCETFGIVLIEAMAAGTAVVATDCGGPPEVLGDAGVLVPPQDVRALADALMNLLADPVGRQNLALRGRGRAHERFALERTVDLFLSTSGDC